MRGPAAVAPAPEAPPLRTTPPRAHTSRLELGFRSHLSLWLLVVFLELSNAALLALWATIYYSHNTRQSLLWVIKVYFLFSEAFHFVERFAYGVATGYMLLCFVFVYRLARLLVASLRHRELRFGLSSSALKETNRHIDSFVVVSRRRIVRWARKLQFLYGVHGPYFELRLLADEVMEVVVQSVAAHSSSQSISNVALNQIYGVVILINSVSTLFFQRVFQSPESLVKQRVARLLTDLVLDFVWGTLLPLWMYKPIIATYYKQKDHGNSIDFTENSAREVERVLVLSWWSFLLSVVPFCNSLLNLAEVRSLLKEEFTTEKQLDKSSSKTLVSLESVIFAHHIHRGSNTVVKHSLSPAGNSYLLHAVHLLIAVAGVGIFITSLIANDTFGIQPHELSYGCVHRVHPWFTTKEACVGRTISCSSLAMDGSSEDIEAALQVFDGDTLADLFISDCESLNLSTPSIQNLPRLQSLVITNCTLVSWAREAAALDNEHFPELRTVKLESVVFDVPLRSVAILTTPLSRSVEWVYISDTNMSESLVDTTLVGENWKHLIYFDCAGCSLTVFPSRVLLSMDRLIMLSLLYNDIDEIPSSWPPASLDVVMVWFDGNLRLTELPDALWRQAAESMQSAYAQNTSLMTVPPWLTSTAASNSIFAVYAFGTPLCESGEKLPIFVVCEFQEL